MKEKIKYIMSRKSFHTAVISIIIAIVLLFLVFVILRYSVEGETNMPFNITKIILISSTEGIEKNAEESKWAFDISQNTDIYMYIEKNNNYQKKVAIKSILIDNIKVEKNKEKGTINIYRPNINEEGTTFKNSEENLVQNIEYEGSMEADLKNLKIANQGGVVIFRCGNDGMSEYTSDEEEISHNQLLQKAGLTEEDVKGNISYDLTMKLESGKEYKATIKEDIPIEGLIEKGTSALEITDLSDIIFKRIKN